MKLKLERCLGYIAKNADQWGAWDLYMPRMNGTAFLYGHPHEVWESLQRAVDGMPPAQVKALHRQGRL